MNPIPDIPISGGRPVFEDQSTSWAVNSIGKGPIPYIPISSSRPVFTDQSTSWAVNSIKKGPISYIPISGGHPGFTKQSTSWTVKSIKKGPLPYIPIPGSRRVSTDHDDIVSGVAVFPDRRRMVTSSGGNTLRLWNPKNGEVLKKMEGHGSRVRAVTVSGDGKLIASSDMGGKLIAWDGDTGESLTNAIQAHSGPILSLDFSPNSAMLASVSSDKTMKLWRTDTWQIHGNPIYIGEEIDRVRYSPSGDLLAIATDIYIQIWDPSRLECIARMTPDCYSLAWTPDGTRLLSGGFFPDCNIREWDTSTWELVGDPWSGHVSTVYALAVNSTGTLLASASRDSHVRLWRISDRRTVAIFRQSHAVNCITFSVDGRYIFCGGCNDHITEWVVPEDILLGDRPNAQTSNETLQMDIAEQPGMNNTSDHYKVLSIATILRNACVNNNLSTDEYVILFANRCKAKLGKMLWEEALIDAQKITELNPCSYLGFQLKHAALHGVGRYDEAIEAFEVMLSNLDDVRDPETQALRQKYISLANVRAAIQSIIGAHLEDIPPRLFDTSSGCLCDREAQISVFTTSREYKKSLSSIISQGSDLWMQSIHDMTAAFFSCVMLSHRWEGNEPSLRDIQDKSIYKFNSGKVIMMEPTFSQITRDKGIMKAEAFCRIARDYGYRWAWIDTCCIDQKDNVEVQRSVNSMFTWYRHSALTIVYLSDVLPSSQPDAMAKSVWITRGWTVQEFLAPEVVLFYQNDWTLYLNDQTPNHKESLRIMQELENATGINRHALTGFRPGMGDSREKLRWASTRVTTLPEDIAYSLFGIFGIHLPIIYGEKKQNALGRLLQEIIAQSGDISCLFWAGKSSEFNSSLPADITSYKAPPFIPPPLSEDDMHSLVSSLQDTGVVELASQLYTTLHDLPTPQFAQHRLHLPCIIFAVTQITLRPRQNQETQFTYSVKANGLQDILITRGDELDSLFCQISSQRKLLLVRPWEHNLLEQYDFPEQYNLRDDVQSTMTEDLRVLPGSPLGKRVQINTESGLRALRLIVGLRQPFRALLLTTQKWRREYNRIATDHDIIAQVNDMASVCDMMDVRTLEIL